MTATDAKRTGNFALPPRPAAGPSPRATRKLSASQAAIPRPPTLPLLRDAMFENRLELWFPPVVDLFTREPAWHEGLLRLRTRSGEVLTPDAFIPEAERHPDMITAIDLHVLKLACGHLAANDLPKISINVSGISISDPGFGSAMEAICTRVPPERRRNLIIEITESAMIKNLEVAKQHCRLAHQLGMRLAMDDFGEAYSSMMILRELPVDILKVDGSFAADLQTSHKCWVITDWMRRLAFDLHMECVLEFISSEELCQEAIKMDFSLGQGYHLGKPLPLRDLYMGR